jgi:hypothetical protein
MEGAIKKGMADEARKVGLSPGRDSSTGSGSGSGTDSGEACIEGGGKTPIAAPVEEGAVFQGQGPGALIVVENIGTLTAKAEKAFEFPVGENGFP